MLNTLPIPSFLGSPARPQPSSQPRGGKGVAPPSAKHAAVDISFFFERRPSNEADADTACPAPRKSRGAAARYGEIRPEEHEEAPAEFSAPVENGAETETTAADATETLLSTFAEGRPAGRGASSFLDELAREAQARRARDAEDEVDREALERNIKLANQACRTALDYWTSMVEHLAVLKPKSGGRYVFDARTVIEEPSGRDFRVVHKSRKLDHGDETFEAVTLCWRVGDGAKMHALKDFPAEVDRLRSRLVFAGVQCHESQSINPSTGRPQGTRFEFTGAVNVSVRIVPLHDQGKISITLCNLDSIGRIEAQLPAFALRTKELDELARWICGQPNSFLKHAQNVTRHEP